MISVLATTVGTLLERSREIGDPTDLAAPEDVAAATARRGPHAERTLAGRIALRLLLAHIRGSSPRAASTLDIHRSCAQCGAPHGRPRSAGHSLSSSTSDRHVLVAVGDDPSPIGVDVQAPPAVVWPGFDDSVLHSQERRDARPDDLRSRIALWTRKEALLKAAGVGLLVDPSTFRLEAHVIDGRRWWRPGTASDRAVQGLLVRDLPGAVPRALAASAPSGVRSISLDAVLGEAARD